MTIRASRGVVGAMMAVVAAGMAAAVARAQPPADWRVRLAQDFQYAPPAPAATAKDALPAWLLSPPTPAAGAGAVKLAPFVVRSKPIYGELTAAFDQQETEARNAEIADRLGIGFAGIRTGDFALGVVTVFHIPVMILGGLSW